MISASSPCACPEDETFHDQVAERRERAATLPASNLDFVELGDAFPANKMMGAATLDRFRHGAYHAVLDVASYRSQNRCRYQPVTSLPEAEKSPMLKGCSNS